MKNGLLCAAALLAAPLLSVSALADEPETKSIAQEKSVDEQNSETPESKEAPTAIEIPEVKAEEKRICRRVKVDMSSRRATRVCKTKEEWRLFNQRR